MTVDEMLAAALLRLDRLEPAAAAAAAAGGAMLVDTRPLEQRRKHGTIPGAILIERNHLEWRLDPSSDARIPQATDHDMQVVIVCQEGYSSSLAAAALQDLGLHRATDVIGGFDRWHAAGLPIDPPKPDGATIDARRLHWDNLYGRVDEQDLSWFEPAPDASVKLLDGLAISPKDSVVDVGAGSSRLVDVLLDRGFTDLTVLDVSEAGLARARDRLGAAASRVSWVVADLTDWIPQRHFDVWHDRAVFHFLTEPQDIRRYRDLLWTAVRPGGMAVIATFAADGPTHCSGLPVTRYSSEQLASILGDGLDMLTDRRQEHPTPSGGIQPFTWAAFNRRAGSDH